MTGRERRDRVVIVGAGVGGLTAALELAHRGLDVLVCERALRPGGKLRQVEIGGRALDVGPTVLTMPWVLRGILGDVGEHLEDHLPLDRAQVIARHFWPDGSRLDLHADEERSAAAVATLAGQSEAEGFLRLLRDARALYLACEAPFLLAERARIWPLVRSFAATARRGQPVPRPYGSMWSALGRYFRDARLRQLFGRYATYYGSSPFLAPATLNLITAVELQGVWLPAGGMIRVADVLSALASSRGVELRYGAAVASITADGGRVTGVELEDGTHEAAGTVVVNADGAALGAGLLGPAGRTALKPLSRRRRSLAAFTIAAVADTGNCPLARHNVFFSSDYAAEFEDILVRRRPPREPTVYVCAQDRPGAEADVTGPERLFFIVNAPPDGDVAGAFDRTEIDRCTSQTLGHLARMGLHLQEAQTVVSTPADFERLFPGTGGALYGPATHSWRAAMARPPARTRLRGLYLAGGSVHPGAGVPMAALSGRLAASAILQDLTSTPLSPLEGTSGGTSTA